MISWVRDVIALTLLSLISTSSKTYTPVFEKTYEVQDLSRDHISDWQLNETYKCPMRYSDQDLIITSSTEITVVEARTEN